MISLGAYPAEKAGSLRFVARYSLGPSDFS